MSPNNSLLNNNYQSELDIFASNPRLRKMAAEHIKIYGSIDGVMRATYSSSISTNKKSSSYSSGENSPEAGSNGKYITHSYYGYQSGNRITTVIG